MSSLTLFPAPLAINIVNGGQALGDFTVAGTLTVGGSASAAGSITAQGGATSVAVLNLDQSPANTGANAANLNFWANTQQTASSSAVLYTLSLRNRTATANQANALILYDYDGTNYHRYFQATYNGGNPYLVIGQQIENVPNVRYDNTANGGGLFSNSLQGWYGSVASNAAGGKAIHFPYAFPSTSPIGATGLWAVASMWFNGSGTMYITGTDVISATQVNVYQSSSGSLNCYVIAAWGPVGS